MQLLRFRHIFAVALTAIVTHVNGFSADTNEPVATSSDISKSTANTIAGTQIEYIQLNNMYQASGTLVVSIDGSEEVHRHAGTCDQWASDIEVYVFFESEEGGVHVHELITDDPNIGWSGPEHSGWTIGDTAYELIPENIIVIANKTTRGDGTATIVNLEDQSRGETSTMQWSVTCG